jgi:hypothetical protein
VASEIFKKEPAFKPSTMAAVAERRFDDAQALCDTGENARANGAAYLAGFVIEILLKSRLVAKFSTIAKKRPHELSDDEREVWGLIWRRHDLEGMLTALKELEVALKTRGERDGIDYAAELKKVCAEWTVYARYSPRTMSMADAKEILVRVRRLKELLK